MDLFCRAKNRANRTHPNRWPGASCLIGKDSFQKGRMACEKPGIYAVPLNICWLLYLTLFDFATTCSKVQDFIYGYILCSSISNGTVGLKSVRSISIGSILLLRSKCRARFDTVLNVTVGPFLIRWQWAPKCFIAYPYPRQTNRPCAERLCLHRSGVKHGVYEERA